MFFARLVVVNETNAFTLHSYLNLAELRFLQKDTTAALTFWKECVDSLQALFMDGVTPLGRLLPPKFYRKLAELFKRAVRFMFCFGSELVNKVRMLSPGLVCVCEGLIVISPRSF